MVEETSQRLEAVERAARKLRAAKHTGEPGDHLEMLYDEVARAFDAILAKHPEHKFSVAQREAIGEIICMAVLANSHADKPAHVRFLSKLWNEFVHLSPSKKIAAALSIIAFISLLTGGISVAWHQAPGALRWAASAMEPSKIPLDDPNARDVDTHPKSPTPTDAPDAAIDRDD